MPTENETKIMTIAEFRYWLEGVEEMQSDEWSPDKRQWDRIREKLNSIANTVATPAPTSIQNNNPNVPMHREPDRLIDRPVQHAPSGMGRVTAPPPSGVLFGNSDNPAFPVKTPNVDSSNGGYEPAFI